jgi:hypothetical protein
MHVREPEEACSASRRSSRDPSRLVLEEPPSGPSLVRLRSALASRRDLTNGDSRRACVQGNSSLEPFRVQIEHWLRSRQVARSVMRTHDPRRKSLSASERRRWRDKDGGLGQRAQAARRRSHFVVKKRAPLLRARQHAWQKDAVSAIACTVCPRDCLSCPRCCFFMLPPPLAVVRPPVRPTRRARLSAPAAGWRPARRRPAS